MIRSCFSDNDIFFRMGGDEFIIYCVNITDELQCKSFINNLYEEIEEIQIKFINNKSIGISLGCCIYNKGATNYNEIYRCSDNALYKSKSKGKGQYTISFLEDR